jgi:hypothetical protein
MTINTDQENDQNTKWINSTKIRNNKHHNHVLTRKRTICNQKRRVLNLNNHPTTYWIYTRSAVSEVLKLTITPDPSCLDTSIRLHTPWKLLHMHSLYSWTFRALITKLETYTFIYKKSRDYILSASSKFITDQTSEKAQPFSSETLSTYSIQHLQFAPSHSATNATSRILFFAEVFCTVCSQA